MLFCVLILRSGNELQEGGRDDEKGKGEMEEEEEGRISYQ
jgi:hypothetical protein